MIEKEGDVCVWLRQTGCQIRAVAVCLKKPMTNSQICEAAGKLAPRIARWDVTKHLRQLTAKGLVYCINPEMHTGKLYWATDYGRQKIAAAFGVNIPDCPKDIDWRAYSCVIAGTLRKAVLLEMAAARRDQADPIQGRNIYRRLRRYRQATFNHVLRAIYDLKRLRLIRCVAFSRTGKMRMYAATIKGMLVANELLR